MDVDLPIKRYTLSWAGKTLRTPSVRLQCRMVLACNERGHIDRDGGRWILVGSNERGTCTDSGRRGPTMPRRGQSSDRNSRPVGATRRR
jgi:hypothetical protein